MEQKNIREILEFKDSKAPFILHNFNFSQYHSLGRCNWHVDLEILYFTYGNASVLYNSENIYVREGDIVIVNSNVLHDIFAKSNLHFYCLIVDNNFCLQNHLNVSNISFCKHFNDTEISDIFEQFIAEFYDYNLVYRSLFLRSTVLKMLALITSKYGDKNKKSNNTETTYTEIKKALEYIHSQYNQKISLDNLSMISGLSKFYLAREFRRIVGYTPGEYVNHIRCEQAKKMLQDVNNSISYISEQCGYSCPSYFSEIFLKTTGMRPRDYRNNFFENNNSE